MGNKICIVCEFPPPPGGMSNQAILLINNLKKEGYDVNKCKINIQFNDPFKFFNNLILSKIFIKFPIILFRLFVNIYKSDVIHIFSICGLYFYVVVTPAVLIAKFFNKKIIINYHAGYFYSFYESSIKFIVRNILRMADYITTPLFHLKNEFALIGISIIAIENLVDLSDFSYKERLSYNPKFISTRHLRYVYGNDVVLKAFKIILEKYSSASLIIAGDGDQREELEKIVKENNLQKNVYFTGYIDKNKLLHYYENSDILLNGSRRDNMPISILEAFASGLPVVSTNPMGIPSFVINGHNGLLSDVDDYEMLAINSIKILNNFNIGKKLANNAKLYVNSLNWDNIYPKIESVYFH